MPRARSPNRDKAFQLWIDSQGRRELKDIAAELGVSQEQVRKWKHNDRWDDKTQKVTLPNGKGHVTKRKRGGQPGNQNAVGNSGGAPPGNKNGFKHGAYERVMAGFLEPDEVEIFEDEGTGEHVERELRQTLAALNAKEVRLMKHIKQIKDNAKGPLVVDSVSRTVADRSSRKLGKEHEEVTVTNTASLEDALIKLEKELDRTQGRKIKVLAQIESIRLNRERLELEKQRIAGEREKNKAADAWIAAMTGEVMEDADRNSD